MKSQRHIRFEYLEERNLLAVLSGLAEAANIPAQTSAHTWCVTTLNDITSESDNLLSLREAVAAASAGDTITFSSNLLGGTIKLTDGHIKITNSVTITGLLNSSGSIGITISGNKTSRIFYTSVTSGTLTIENLNLINGNAGEGAAGSGIFNTGNLNIKNCSFSGNSASGRSYGGSIRNFSGTLTITDCVFKNNNAYLGAGISNKSGTITITGTTFANNNAAFNGGAIYNQGTAVITSCSIYNNNAQSGAGIRNFGTLTLINSRITANTASNMGGAVWNSGNSTLKNCTVAGNKGALCGGIYHDSSESGSLSLFNTIIYSNTQSDASSLAGFRDIRGEANGSFNLSSKTINGTANIVYTSTAASLFTAPTAGDYSLTENSAAIDAGSNAYAVDINGKALTYDLSDQERIVNKIVDIGAYEYQEKPSIEITLTGYSGNYDGLAHGIVISGTVSTDTVYYSTDGKTFSSTVPISYVDAGTYKVYAKVVRSGYAPWVGSADIIITPRQLNVIGTTVSDKVYDGTTAAEITMGSVSGLLTEDDVTVSAYGSFPSSQIGTYNVTVSYKLSGQDTMNYEVPKNDVVEASIVSELTKKISVTVVISTTPPTAAELSVLPSSLTTVDTGSTIYAQIWVKNADGSNLGITGGYIDLSYTYPQLAYGTFYPGDLFSEASNLVNSSVKGTLSLYGGCPNVEMTDIGVSNWILLGCNTFTVQSAGTIKVCSKTPTLNGTETSSLNLTRLTVGTLKTSEIEYNSVTFTAETKLPKVAVPTITAIASYGGNNHLVTWNSVVNAQKYELQWSNDPSSSIWGTSTTVTLSDIISGLTYGDLVYYRLRALGDGVKYDNSDWTEVQSLRVCPMDVDSDGFIGVNDYSLVSSHWLTTPLNSNWDARCDIDGDKLIGPGDWSFLIANWFKESDSSNLYYPAIRADFSTNSASLDFQSVDGIFASDDAIFEVW